LSFSANKEPIKPLMMTSCMYQNEIFLSHDIFRLKKNMKTATFT